VARNGADVSTTLYRAYDERGVLLYVGIANTPLLRVEQHSSTARWACYAAKITFERHPSRPEAAEAEVTAIKVEKPAFNIAHSGGGGELELAYLEDRRAAGLHVEWPPPRSLYQNQNRGRSPMGKAALAKAFRNVQPLVTPHQLAEQWGCSPQDVIAFIYTIPSMVSTLMGPGGLYRYNPDELDQIPEGAFQEWKTQQKQWAMNLKAQFDREHGIHR
jgi:hypothetical protein